MKKPNNGILWKTNVIMNKGGKTDRNTLLRMQTAQTPQSPCFTQVSGAWHAFLQPGAGLPISRNFLSFNAEP